jgi:uncharacterized protein
MTQPAKSQEPSMEEILASIRRIIADDNAGKKVERVPEAPVAPAPEALAAREAFVQPAMPPRPSFFAPPEPSDPEIHAEAAAGPAATSGAEEDQAAEILDLTESMTARVFGQPEPAPAPSPAPYPMSQFEKPDPALQFQEPEPAPQLPMTENYSDVSVEEVVEQSAMPRTLEQSAPYVAPETEQRSAGERDAGGRGQLLSSATSAAVDSAFNALAHTVLVQNARTLEDLVREMLRPMLKTWLDDNLPGMVERLVRAEIERVARGR